MTKKIISILCLSLCLFLTVPFVADGIDVSAQSCVLLDARTEKVIFEKDAYSHRSMASTTKIMTALLAVESGKLENTVCITKEMTGAIGTSVGLKSGYKLKLIDLVYAMMLESGNDAAQAVAVYLGGDVSTFVTMMNVKAKRLGMNNTSFETPSGLDGENHYSTAYDMALLACNAMKNPILRNIVSTKSAVIEVQQPQFKMYLSNHNRLLSENRGIIGVKTGFTKKSGRCLVTALEKDGAFLIAVTLSAPNDWRDHRLLLDYGVERLTKCNTLKNDIHSVKVVSGESEAVGIYSDNDVEIAFFGNNNEVKRIVYLPKFVYAPIKCGDELGKIEYVCGEKIIKTVSLFASSNVEQIEATFVEKKNPLQRLKDWLYSLFCKEV